MKPLSRRRFVARTTLATVAAGAVFGPAVCAPRARTIPGKIVGASSALGHALRDGRLPVPTREELHAVVIVGGGISGLAAARSLKRSGVDDLVLLELEAEIGGNACSGRNRVSRFPWGAHYLPLPSVESVDVLQLLEELGVITGRDAAGRPMYDEEMLCADPMERLFLHGRWQEGLVPHVGVTPRDQSVIDAFFAEMEVLRQRRGADGRRLFVIPLDESSTDPAWRRLDLVSMETYMRERGWASCAPLRWYVDYCCRDDYGGGMARVSAWAGVHYFAARNAVAANAPAFSVLTWPEGNAWLANRLRQPLASCIRTSTAVWQVQAVGTGAQVDYYDAVTRTSTRVHCEAVVWAAPWFVARRAVAALRAGPREVGEPVYSPWVVANLTLPWHAVATESFPAWDNVIYGGDSLGYVVATHQGLQPFPEDTVISYYHPLDRLPPEDARTWALQRSHAEWGELVLRELSAPHPRLAEQVEQLDVWVWGHGMVRPVPGYIWGAFRNRLQQGVGPVAFAHSDGSGLALFEEAYTRGTQAGKRVAERVAGRGMHAA